MGLHQASFYCIQCRQQKLFTRQGTNHVLHLLVTLFLCGLYLPIWILIAIDDNNKPYFCSTCGYSNTPRNLANPMQAQQQILLAQRRKAESEKRKQEFFDWVKSTSVYLWLLNPRNSVPIGAAIILVGGAGLIGANYLLSSKPRNNTQTLVNNPTTNNLLHFSPQEVCMFPKAATNKKFHSLAAGKWQRSPAGEDFGYDCGRQTEYQFYKQGIYVAQIEYAVIGDEKGARYIAIDYFVSGEKPLANETTYRKEFIVFLHDVTKKALKTGIPQDLANQIADLKGYANTGVSNSHKFEIGNGSIVLSRNKNQNNSLIFVKAQIFADKNTPVE